MSRSTFGEYQIVDQFNSSYWSGLDLKIYANNVFLDEAVQLNFTISEQVRPYYSYSSYVPTRIYHGSRVVAGELTLNFKRDSTIYSLVSLMKQDTNTTASSVPNNTQTTPVPINTQTQSISASQLANPDVAKAFMAAKKSNLYTDPTLTSIPINISDSAALYETKRNGFDVNIILGGSFSSGQTMKLLSDSNNYWLDGEVVPSPGVQSVTGLRLTGVEIANIARSMGDDGRNFVETYSFMARSVKILDQNEITGPNFQQSIADIKLNT